MPITPKLADQARQDIFQFIDRIVEVLRVIIHDPPRYKEVPLVRAEMIEPLQKAWEEFSADFDLQTAYHAVSAVPDYKLQSCGLYGAQGRAKLQLFDARLDAFERDINKKNLIMLVDAMDIYLGSISEAGGLDGGLKELAELLRHSIDH